VARLRAGLDYAGIRSRAEMAEGAQAAGSAGNGLAANATAKCWAYADYRPMDHQVGAEQYNELALAPESRMGWRARARAMGRFPQEWRRHVPMARCPPMPYPPLRSDGHPNPPHRTKRDLAPSVFA